MTSASRPAIIDFAVPQMVPQWQRSARRSVPTRVRYSFDTTWDSLGLVHNSSAWLQHLHPAVGTDGSADAEALTLPATATALTETTSTGGSAIDRSVYLLRDSLRQPISSRPVSNSLSLTTSNLNNRSVELSQLQVNTTRRYCLSLTTDTATTVSPTRPARSPRDPLPLVSLNP